ncbi:MAG TPA: hypothetical protein VFE67_00370 [Rudaea sp.]|nr:hypothetical protein [Rudaea sp.]
MKRNPIFLSTVITFAAMASLSGCSWFHQKSDVYSGAVESRPLEVPPDLDSPANANELLVPPVGATTASGVAAANAAPAQPAQPTLAANQLLVADNAADTWTKVGPAIDSAKIGTVSSRDENQRSFILDFNAPIPKPSAESHWYTAVFNHLGFGEGDPVKAHLLVRVVDDGAASKVVVAGNGSDKAAAAASLRVIQILHDKLPGSTFPPASTPPPAVAGAAPASAPPSATPPPPPPPAAPGNELRVADSVKGTWIKVGAALERNKLGTLSARDDNAYTYTFDFDSSLPKPESEKHWYNHIGIGGGGDTVKTRLVISVLDDGGGSSRIHVAGNPGDKAAAAASESVIESLHDRVAGASLVATTAPATTYAAAPAPAAAPASTYAAPPASAPPAMASTPPAAPPSSTPPPIAVASTGSTDLHVADTVPNTWTRVGLALERAQLGALSGRDANAHTYTLDFSATLATNAEGEHHWYTRVLHPFGGGDETKTQQVTRRLTVRVAEDAGGARVDVQGDATDKETMAAARHVAQVLRERLT